MYKKNLSFLYKLLGLLVLTALFSGFFLIPTLMRILIVPLEYEPLSKCSQSDPINLEIFFTNTQDSKSYLEECISAVEDSKYTIDIAMYSFNSRELVRVLKDASKRGVKVTLVIDHEHVKKARGLFGLDSDLIELLPKKDSNFAKHTGNMHHKFVLVDKEMDPLLIASSLNTTDIQNENDIGYVLTTNNKEIIRDFSLEFDRLKSGNWGLSKIDNPNYLPFSKRILTSGEFFDIWWSPGIELNSIKGKMLEIINSAKEKIWIICWQITDEEILGALVEKASEDVDVQVIMDRHPFLLDETINFMDNPLIKIYLNEDSTDGSLKSFIHEHVLLVDDRTVLFGTNNWSGRGALSNDEYIFYTNNSYLVNSFLEHFIFLQSMVLNR